MIRLEKIQKIYKKIIDQYKKIRYDQSVLSSLTNTQIFNNTAIEYIFKGNLDRNGNAGGYHYEEIIGTPGKTISGTELPENSYGVYKAQVQVNGNNKSANNGYSTFFPKDMSPQEVVDAINEAYGNKVFVSGTRNTYEGISSGGIVISMYINGNGKIISAFPKG